MADVPIFTALCAAGVMSQDCVTAPFRSIVVVSQPSPRIMVPLKIGSAIAVGGSVTVPSNITGHLKVVVALTVSVSEQLLPIESI